MSAQGDGGRDEVAGFAALLRELKERTDRSYGSLARRLGMNTSTLHRYCAGDAVPVDFAPAERFAALCGATPEERLELHRRWLAATATRQRPRATGPAGSGSEPAPDTPTATTDVDAGTRQNIDTQPEPATEPHEPRADERTPSASVGEPGGPRGAGSGPTGGSGRGSAPVDGRGDADESGVGGEAVWDGGVVRGPVAAAARRGGAGATGPAGGGGPGRRWYRRRRVLLAVACAVLGVAGSLSALPDGGGKRSAADGVRAGGEPSVSVSGSAGRGEASSSASPSPSASGTARRPHGTDGSGGPRDEPSASATGTDAAPSGPGAGPAGTTPLAWTVDSQAWDQGCGHDYVVGKPPAQVPPPPAPQDAGVWAATQNAVHGRETLVEVSVQGRSEAAVVLTALRVRVAGRSEPVAGNAYAMDQGCGGALTPRYFDVDLDKDRPIARAVPGNDAGTPIPAVRLPYRVSAKDPEVLLVTARTGTCDCRWYLELDWSSQGRTGTVRIDDHGRPFRTSAIEGLPHYEYDTLNRRWRTRGS
ncbi:helix-turn-helix domain-containing protein [Streptomyces sp. 15-116A]|uniref:helix-turn-helix domain-containing protein n=1 Tax=Streptomyces sp. 15-116A TaxID=2259035 RepID=UPI0037DA5C17